MRLLHTSDWHLGRSLHRADLRAAQEAFVDALVETVSGERVDVVVVAGDVFDRAIPPVDAVELCEEALVRLRAAGAAVVVTSGNHDSARRLGFGSRLLREAGVHLRTRPADLATPVLLTDGHGTVAVYGVPYLEPAAVGQDLPAPPDGCCADDPPRGHVGVLTRATDCIRADLAGRGQVRSIVAAHAWVTGGLPSESERDITVGGVGHVPVDLFAGFTYTALGHLHGPQTVTPTVRYSGSPLAYSFSEATHQKLAWLVDLDATGIAAVDPVPLPVPRRLATISGDLETLLSSPAYDDIATAYLSVTLTDPARPEGAMERLRRRFPHVLVLGWQPAGQPVDLGSYRARVVGRSDAAVSVAFVQHVRGTPASDRERALLADAFAATRLADAETHPAPATATAGVA